MAASMLLHCPARVAVIADRCHRAGSAVTSDIRFCAADDPEGKWQMILPRQHNVEYDADPRGDHFFIEIRWAAQQDLQLSFCSPLGMLQPFGAVARSPCCIPQRRLRPAGTQGIAWSLQVISLHINGSA